MRKITPIIIDILLPYLLISFPVIVKCSITMTRDDAPKNQNIAYSGSPYVLNNNAGRNMPINHTQKYLIAAWIKRSFLSLTSYPMM